MNPGRFKIRSWKKLSRLTVLELDHVIFSVADLEAAGREMEARYGLVSIEGSHHPNWGTANRIVPLGEAYIELVAVVDRAEASRSTFGSWVARATPTVGRPLGWAVRTGELDGLARRLHLLVEAGSRIGPNGNLVQWRLAGVKEAAAEPSLPFFIEWGKGVSLPGRAAAAHRAGSLQIARLKLSGDPRRLATWLGPHSLPIEVESGTPAVMEIVVRGDTDDFVLDAVTT